MHVFWTIPPLYIILCRQGQSSGIMNVSFKSIHHFVEYLNVDQSCGSVLTGQLLHSHLVKFPQPPFPLLPVLHPFINSSPSLRPTRTSSISPPCSSHRSSCYRTTNFNNRPPTPPPPRPPPFHPLTERSPADGVGFHTGVENMQAETQAWHHPPWRLSKLSCPLNPSTTIREGADTGLTTPTPHWTTEENCKKKKNLLIIKVWTSIVRRWRAGLPGDI